MKNVQISSNSNIKPCKLCGNMPYFYSDYSSELDKTMFNICCLDNDCMKNFSKEKSVSYSYYINETSWIDSEEAVIEIWNKMQE